MDDSLHLPTPDSFPAFPFQPYGIQLELMKNLYAALEDRKVAVLESPTGTGKSLSLLCGAMTWLRDNKQRAIRGELENLKLSIRNDNEPEWVSRQILEKHKRELEQMEADLEERLQAARRREEKIRQQEQGRARKRAKVVNEDPRCHSEDDNAFLPDGDASDEEDNISPAVRALMKKLEASRRKDEIAEPEEPTCTKIYYASRTHTQLSQFLGELRKTPYQTDARTVPLGSRKNLCINDDVKKGKYGADIDEACRALATEKEGKRCAYLPPLDEQAKMIDMRDHILSAPKDIEDLEMLGRQTSTCPYYGTRRAIKQAELVTLPYNLLLQNRAREALGIDLTDQIVIVDEAHNLIDTILAVHTLPVSSSVLRVSKTQVDIYRSKFRNRLKTKHVVHLTRLSVLLTALQNFIGAWMNGGTGENKKLDASSGKKKPPQEEMFGVAEFIRMLGAHAENINPLEIEKYLRESKIARKINGYSDKLADAAAASDPSKRAANARRKGATPPLHAIESLLLALANPDEDGRIFLSRTGNPGAETAQLKYQLLNPSTHFREVVEKARSVVLAGGTMSPIGDFHTQLFSYLAPERLVVYSCGHVVPKSNIRTIVLGKGPRGKSLEFKFGARGDEELIAELGQTVLNLTSLVPNGFVVFLPSYAFLSIVKAAWSKGENKILERLGKKKKVFYEPQENGDVEGVLREFSAAADSPVQGLTGAILFAVVGAKLSEGLNFSDGLARAVAIVGLPFANLGSAELQARMKYVREHSSSGTDAGKELYENLCMRATNQSIGRAIRHRGDWAAIIFIDQRYGTPRIRSKLPGWIGTDLEITDKFGDGMKHLGEFFRSKKQES
ncbi:chromosome transmission fidelity protein 1 [Rhizoctonia solani]|uniref:ATP-dependent DNA helicase CHL1 n=1 Tax=Rhizoctonia solani TaxID=456999 RepID=A0A0K6GF20_9AGAM|nr:chromosome transmission fidelity protein 1 [Rhizoctonia solani]